MRAERALHLALAGGRVLPAVEAVYTNDLVDVANHSLDDDWRLGVLHRLEEFREGRLAAVDFLLGHEFRAQLDLHPSRALVGA